MNAGLTLPSGDDAAAAAAVVESVPADIFAEEEEARPAPGTDADATKPEAGEPKAANAAAVNSSRDVVDIRTAGCNNDTSCPAVVCSVVTDRSDTGCGIKQMRAIWNMWVPSMPRSFMRHPLHTRGGLRWER